MTLRIVAVVAACIGLVCANLAFADGMPDPEDENYNPVPSKPGVPAPGGGPLRSSYCQDALCQ